MGKVILAMSMSVDGYVEGPNGELDWMFRSFNEEIQEYVLQGLSQSDQLLLGRVNYEGQAAVWPGQSNPIADMMNKLPKVVFSKSLDKAEWNNTTIASGDLADEIAKLKANNDRELKFLGGVELAQSLSEAGLIDEYQLVVCPTALGGGRSIFGDGHNLKLESSRPFSTGAILNTYSPA